jgi:hypothetical protein
VTDIGVMTPFREQVWRVREALRKEKMASVDVGSVEVRLIFQKFFNSCRRSPGSRPRCHADRLPTTGCVVWQDYQGREARITLVSTVRSRSRFLEEDKRKGMGIVFEQKRFNVAITRAKELLVVVGNAKLLSKDPYWNALLSFALRNKLCVYSCHIHSNSSVCCRRLIVSWVSANAKDGRRASGSGRGEDGPGGKHVHVSPRVELSTRSETEAARVALQ